MAYIPEISSNAVFEIKSEQAFEFLALKTFQHQALHCATYAKYLFLRNLTVESVEKITQIYFLPVEFFKSERIRTDAFQPAKTFASSSTTGTIPSLHDIRDLAIYEQSFLTGFKNVYGNPSDYVILGLLPSYLERPGSSLVYMVEKLISDSKQAESGFFLDDFKALNERILDLKKQQKKFILFGVSFALVDFAAAFEPDLSGNIVIETGGMKGRKREMTREELHSFLMRKFNLSSIHSEYGMTELLSQAYAVADGRFRCPPWMKILIRDINDPTSLLGPMQTGAVNIIDLANMHSCSFIATDDLGRIHQDGTFEILGRYDLSETRGCSLLVS